MLGNYRVAEQPSNYRAAQHVIGGKAVAPHGGNSSRGYSRFVSGDLTPILRIRFANRANRAHAHAVQIGAGFRRVALEISVQSAVLLGDSQFVSGAREMVHADV